MEDLKVQEESYIVQRNICKWTFALSPENNWTENVKPYCLTFILIVWMHIWP